MSRTNIVFRVRTLGITKTRLKRHNMIEAQILRINRLLTEVTKIAISFENALVTYLANLCFSFMSNATINIFSIDQWICLISFLAISALPLYVFLVLRVLLVVAFHPLSIALKISYPAFVISPKMFDILLSELLIMLASTFFAMTLMPILASSLVKFIIRFFFKAFSADFGFRRNEAGTAERLCRWIFSTNLASWFHSILQSFVIMKVIKGLEVEAGSASFFSNEKAKTIEEDIDSDVVYYLHGKPPYRFVVTPLDASSIDGCNIGTASQRQNIIQLRSEIISIGCPVCRISCFGQDEFVQPLFLMDKIHKPVMAFAIIRFAVLKDHVVNLAQHFHCMLYLFQLGHLLGSFHEQCKTVKPTRSHRLASVDGLQLNSLMLPMFFCLVEQLISVQSRRCLLFSCHYYTTIARSCQESWH